MNGARAGGARQTTRRALVEGRTMVMMEGKRSVVALMLVGGVALADGFMVQPSSNVLSPGGDSLSSASRRSLGEGLAAGRRSTTAPLGREFADPRRQRRAGAACGAHAGGGSGGAEAAVRFIKRGAGGRPRLAVVAEKIAKAAMWILAGGKVQNIKVSFSARTNTDVIQGRLGRADLSFEEADGPILRGRSGALTSPKSGPPLQARRAPRQHPAPAHHRIILPHVCRDLGVARPRESCSGPTLLVCAPGQHRRRGRGKKDTPSPAHRHRPSQSRQHLIK